MQEEEGDIFDRDLELGEEGDEDTQSESSQSRQEPEQYLSEDHKLTSVGRRLVLVCRG